MQFAPTDKFCPLDCTEETWPQCSHLSVPSDIRFYYVVELAYYIQAILALLFWETRRKDFAVMMMHHVVTVALITYSDVRHQERFGSMVFLLHDVADPPMEIAKLFNYSKNRFMSAVFFLTFVAAWITSRLVYLPAVLIRAVFEATTIQCRHIANRIWVESTRFGGMLIVLFCFHLYWTYFILVILARALKGIHEDPREDYSDDDEEEIKLEQFGRKKGRAGSASICYGSID